MSVLVILMLSGLVSVWSQSTLLDSQCDGHCRNIEIRRLVAMMKYMERDALFLKVAYERSEKIIELETKIFENQKTSYVNELSNLSSQLSDQEKKFENRIQELDQKMKNHKDTIYRLLPKVSELTSEDCDDIQAFGYQTSGVYGVNAGNLLIKRVYCEMTSDGKAWTRILHRQDNLSDFTYKNWVEYEAGFGDPQGSHWMGLGLMHQLNTSREYIMRVDLVDWEGKTAYAIYSVFSVGPTSNHKYNKYNKYRFTIGGYSGTAGDSMWKHNDMRFTTIDQDHDGVYNNGNRADGTGSRTGGWWYFGGTRARLTSTYLEGGDVPFKHGIQWPDWRGRYYSYKVATMKIRRQ